MADQTIGPDTSKHARSEREESSVFFARLFDRLLAMLSETAVESEGLQTNEFRSKLDNYRMLIAGSSRGEDIMALAGEGLNVCQDYFERSKKLLLLREAEIGQVTGLLRQILGALSSLANDFQLHLKASWERIGELEKIEDARELKRRISEETATLREIVDVKQRKAEECYKRLTEQVESLQRCVNQNHSESSLDPLTRVANRNGFDRSIQRWVELNKSGRNSVLVLLDIDDFKLTNQKHGRRVGDRILQCAAMWLSRSVRSTDFVARYGDDEFAVVLTSISMATAQAKFSALLQRIAASNFEYVHQGKTREVRLTLCCGLVQFDAKDTVESLLRRADELLVQAKRLGKNRIVAEVKNMDPVKGQSERLKSGPQFLKSPEVV